MSRTDLLENLPPCPDAGLKLRDVPDEEIPALMIAAARAAFGKHYDPDDAETLALYHAGYWYSQWFDNRFPDDIAKALGVDEATYRASRAKGTLVAFTSHENALKQGYDDFLLNLRAALYE